MCNVCNAIYCGEDTSSIVCVALLQITLRNVLKSIEGMHKQQCNTYNARQCMTIEWMSKQQCKACWTSLSPPRLPLPYHSSTNLVHFSFAHLLIVKFVKDIPLEHWEILNGPIFDFYEKKLFSRLHISLCKNRYLRGILLKIKKSVGMLMVHS